MEEEDFIYCPRLGNSLEKLMNKNPNGVDDDRISKMLMMTKQEISGFYTSALNKIRKVLKIGE